MKTLSSGRVLDVEQPLHGSAVGAHALGLSRLEADAQLVAGVRRRRDAPLTRVARCPKRTSSRSLRVRGERPVQPK